MDGQPAEGSGFGMGLPAKLFIRDTLERSARAVHFHFKFGEQGVFHGHSLRFSSGRQEFVNGNL